MDLIHQISEKTPEPCLGRPPMSLAGLACLPKIIWLRTGLIKFLGFSEQLDLQSVVLIFHGSWVFMTFFRTKEGVHPLTVLDP
jgi:hypothetical protein